MPTADEWRDVRDAMGEGGPNRNRHTRRIYELAVKDGSTCLRVRWEYSDEEAIDLIHDVLAEAWDAVLAAESPRALFLKVLVFRAIDRYRRATRAKLLPETAADTVAELTEASVTAPISIEEALELLEVELSPRDMRVFLARAVHDEETQAIARAEELTEANVYQIVCRARKRLKEHLDAHSD